MVVEYGTGHGSCDNILKSLRQSVNTYQVDVLTNGAACSLDSLKSTKSHSIVVAEYNFDVIAVLCKGVSNELLSLLLLPHTNLLIQLVNLKAGILKSLDGELGTILSINVLRVTLDHDVIDLAVAVEVYLLKAKVSNQLTLHGTGLTSVASDIADLHVVVSPSLLFLSIRLTVDVNQRDVSISYHVCDGCCGRRVNRVDDENVNTLSDEVLNLVGLSSLVVSAINDGDVLRLEALSLKIGLQFVSEQGHEVIGELVNADADLLVCKITGSCLCCCLCGLFC